MSWSILEDGTKVVPKIPTLLALIVGSILLVRLLLIGRRPKDYPPGPPTLPLLGNLHQFPKNNLHLRFQEWAKEYGPIVSVMVGIKTYVILSSDEVVKDLLDKRSNIYSSRPDMYVANNFASGNLRYLLMPYDARWRMSRKTAHSFLNVQVSKKYIVYQDLENKQALNDLLDDPNAFVKHFRRFATSLSAIMIFGFRCPTYDDHEVAKLYEVIERFSIIGRSTMAAFMDFYPILRYIPHSLNPIIKSAKEMFQEAMELYLQYWEHVKENERKGIGIKSFCQDLIRTVEKGSNEDGRFYAFMAGMLMEGGSETTSTTIQGFIQAMAVHPDVQCKAQEEVDRVVGKSRLPNLDDWADLPYIRACVKEVLRWLPTITLGIPHATSTDDNYMGYRIPKGAQVICNIWSINMDEERAPNPRIFRPERYLGDDLTAADSAALPDPTKRDHFTFGGGRRICQGLHIAERSLFLAISRLMWGFNIRKAKGPSGEEIPIPIDRFSDAIVLIMDDFQVDIRPRDAERAEKIRQEWKDAKAVFKEMNLPV